MGIKYLTSVLEISDGQEEATVEQTLGELAHEIHGYVGVKMQRLNVCVWEVKLWVASTGPANGAWRVVVMNVTGHTCVVHVSFSSLSSMGGHKFDLSAVD